MHREWIIFCGAGMSVQCLRCLHCIEPTGASEFGICFGARQQHLTFFVLHNHAIEPQLNAWKARRPVRRFDVTTPVLASDSNQGKTA